MRFRKDYNSWERGVISGGREDKVPDSASPHATNAALLYVGSNPVMAVPAKRLGCAVVTAVAESGTPAILGLYHYRRRSGSSYTNHELCVTDTGRLSKLNSAGAAWESADSGTAAPFTSQAIESGVPPDEVVNEAYGHLPDFETMNNLCFIVNGQEARKYDGSNIYNFGLVAPAAPTTADSGVAGQPSGTYEFKLTLYNSNTGHESSPSPVSTALAVSSKKITITTTAANVIDNTGISTFDNQVTHVRIYARLTTLSSDFFRLSDTEMTVNDGDAYAAAHGGWATDGGNHSWTFNLDNTDLNNLTAKVPGLTENEPPPSGTMAIAEHLSRMFATDGIDLYYSGIGKPESFDTTNDFERVAFDDGQRILGIKSISENILAIFKERSTYALVGTDANSWEVRLIDDSVGMVAQRSLFSAEGIVYWWSQYGPYSWKPGGKPEPLAYPDISDLVGEDAIYFKKLRFIVGAPDVERQRIMWAVTEVKDGAASQRNSAILSYNYRLGVWEGKWDPMDVSALAVLHDTNDTPFVHIGNYKGRLFRMWSGNQDGARTISGGTTFTLEGSPTETSAARTLVDSGATFDTADAGLDELYVYAISQDNRVQRNRIVSSTGTVLTLANNWTLNPTTAFTYVIASPNFCWELAHSNDITTPDGHRVPQPFRRKRYKEAYINALCDTGNLTITLEYLVDNPGNVPTATTTILASDTTLARFGTAEFGEAVFGSAKATPVRVRIGRAGRSFSMRVCNREPNTQMVLLNVGIRGSTLSEKG